MICYQITVELVSESSLPASTGIALKVKVKVKYRRNLTASRIYRNIYSYQLSLPPETRATSSLLTFRWDNKSCLFRQSLADRNLTFSLTTDS